MLTDLQGSHGFSGTGYFHKGLLAAVHKGQGDFYHFDCESIFIL